MMIYTSTMTAGQVGEAVKRGMGCLIASSPGWLPSKAVKEVPCALDNGAFNCWRKGYPFQADVFMKTMSACYRLGVQLDWIVCPDIVAAGAQSLDFSIRWARDEFPGFKGLAFVVQDGMSPQDLTRSSVPQLFSRIFIGGTEEWKWATAPQWRQYATANEMPLHIGRVGTVDRLMMARDVGADSVDSSSFVRNGSWRIVDEFMERADCRVPRQLTLEEMVA